MLRRLRDVVGPARGSATRLAEETGIPQSTLARYLRGERVPTVDLLSRIAEARDASLDWLVRGVGPRRVASRTGDGYVADGAYRRYPVLGEVPAGPPGGWSLELEDDLIDTELDVRDDQAIALVVRGDSMYPTLFDGDHIVMSPNASWSTGDLVVAEVQGIAETYLVKRLGRTRNHDEVALISDNFLGFEPLVVPVGDVEVRGRVEVVVRRPGRREHFQAGMPELLDFYLDPVLRELLEELHPLSETGRQIARDSIAAIRKAGV